ncbi:helix-turn-helix transcriptional regulator [Streptomyces sp. NPDC048518]|uniref:helix-turn-helix domain-containing protein n=1 Tax=Streptomyces sp. NPDC048518 TaxID=3155029 RepID=UPI0033F3F529
MSEPSGPTVRRRRLGSELRGLRERVGFDQARAAEHLECSTSKISRLEKGQGLAKAIEIRSLLDLYGVTEEAERDAVLKLHRTAGELGWWEQAEFEEVMPTGLGVYVGLEYDARSVQTWELGFVPGLLQTADYARAVLSAVPRSADEIERLVEVRNKRRARLSLDREPLELWAVIDESVLRRPIGGADVMRDQLSTLADSASQPNVTIQIYPTHKDSHPGLRGSFSLLEFGPADPRIGYVDSPAGNAFLEKDKQVRSLVTSFDRLRVSAMEPEKSAALLHELAAEENDHEPPRPAPVQPQ